MLEHQIPNSHIYTEGWTGEVEELVKDPWPEIFSARQNGTILQLEARGLEQYKIKVDDKLKRIPCQTVDFYGVKGLIPIHLTRHKKLLHLRQQSGLPMAFVIVQIDKENNLFIADQKQAIEKMREITFKKAYVGATIFGTVRDIKFSYAIVDVGGILTKVEKKEISHGWVENISNWIEIGKTYKFKVKEIDEAKGKIKVSLKDLLPNPWPEAAKKYPRGSERVGIVSGITEYGTFVVFEPGVQGLSPHKQFLKLKKGDKVYSRILKTDISKERISIDIIRKIR